MFRIFTLLLIGLLLPLLAQRAITPEPDEALQYGARYITVQEAKKLHEAGSATFCDSRKTREFIIETVEGAVACLYDEKGGMDNKLPDFDPSADTWFNEKVPDKTRPLVIFCNAKGCWRSYKAAVTAVKQGYEEVYWMRDGIPAWKDAGYETESNCPL
jgi:rhodanese-related sulfurtransferase